MLRLVGTEFLVECGSLFLRFRERLFVYSFFSVRAFTRIPAIVQNLITMRRRRFPLLFLFACLLLVSSREGRAQEEAFPSYHSLGDIQASAPGALRYGLYGFDNPAMLAPQERSDLAFILSDGGGSWNDFQRWGLFAGLPGFGFGMLHDGRGEFSVTDYRISLAAGDRSGGFGIGYGWSGGEGADTLGRRSHLTLGLLSRPNRYVSVGLSGAVAFSGGGSNGVLGLAVRPFGNELVSLFGDYSLDSDDRFADGNWSAGAVFEPLQGVRITGRYFDTKTFSMGLGFSLGSLGLGSTTAFDEDFERVSTTYSLRIGQYDRNVFRSLDDGTRYLVMNLRGGMAYRRYLLFDDTRLLSETLEQIEAAREDPTVTGIAINTSGMAINREMLSELRLALQRFKTAGKVVVVYFDRADIDSYHFSSVADRVIMDPLGSLNILGYASGRTYYREMLEKVGIGFEEIRLFRYKSAYEDFARSEMSEGEREQRGRMIQVLYEQARAGITRSRGLSEAEFDRIVDSIALMRAPQAVELNLVDTVGRWDVVRSVMASLGGRTAVGAGSLARYQLPTDDRWGSPQQIAVLYAQGVCAMDQGINARALSSEIDRAASDPDVKAVVLRVDSPGGDGLASDLVAEAMRRCSRRKPVIVSQGFVAASGGYWISMYADEIVASPVTITGSIGVITGWVYNNGAFDSLGATSFILSEGAHADLGQGPMLPFINLSLPHRNLTPDERQMFEKNIQFFYRNFVEKVADGRGLSYDQVDSIAQGRVWMGVDAQHLGLVDSLGGLDLAIAIARERAGIAPDEEVAYTSWPSPGLFDPGLFTPNLLSMFGGKVDAVREPGILEDLRFRLENNGEPLPILPSELMESCR